MDPCAWCGVAICFSPTHRCRASVMGATELHQLAPENNVASAPVPIARVLRCREQGDRERTHLSVSGAASR